MNTPTKPPKSKLAQMRAASRKRQKRITFVSQLPYVFGVFVYAGAQMRFHYSQELTGAVILFFTACAVISWFVARAMKNAPDPFGFKEEGFSGEGVCPDCGAKDTLEYHVDEKKLKAKRVVGFVVALGMPFFILFFFPFFVFINPHAELSEILLPVALILLLPFLVGLDSLNLPREEVCRTCGRDEPVPFNQLTYSKDFALGFIEHVWRKVWRRRKLTIAIVLILPLIFFVFVLSLDVPVWLDKFATSLWLVALPLSIWLLPTAFSANRYYENFFGIKKKKEDEDEAKTHHHPVEQHHDERDAHNAHNAPAPVPHVAPVAPVMGNTPAAHHP